MNTTVSETTRSKGEERVSESSGTLGFWFMKKVVRACMRLTSDEIREASRDGNSHFAPYGNGARIVRVDEEIPKRHATVLTMTAIRRSWILAPGFPDLGLSDKIETIVYGSGESDYDPNKPDVRRGTTTFGKILADAKKQFLDSDKVSDVRELFSGDRMFVTFEGVGELYSITVRDSSVTVWGKDGRERLDAALCDVTYRIVDASGKRKERSLTGIMRLPLKIGGRMSFSDAGKLVRELSERPIQSIHLIRNSKAARR